MKMRFVLGLAFVLVGISAGGWAQQKNNQFKVKSTPVKEKKSAALPMPKTAGTATTSGSKNLQALEHQTARTSGASKGAAKKNTPALKAVKDKPNPPMNFGGGGGGGKGGGAASQSSNPYKGRLRQKHSHQ
jgi:hypothetical protein